LLPDALHFILETLVVGIALFRANEMQDREHIVGDTLVHVPQIGDIPPAIFRGVMPASKKSATRRNWPVSFCAISMSRVRASRPAIV